MSKDSGMAYIIVEYDWMYNDEYYYTTDHDAGHPRVAYHSREKAEEDCRRRNREGMASIALNEYCWEYDVFQQYHEINEETVEVICERNNIPFDSESFFNEPLCNRGLPQHDIDTILDMLPQQMFYSVQAIPIEIESKTLEQAEKEEEEERFKNLDI